MIRHVVLTRFREDVGETTIHAIYAGLAAVADRLDGAHDFVGGPSNSPEDLERGYTHGFTIDFDDHSALAAYAGDPEHRRFGAQLVANAVDGRGGILVVDLEF